MEHSTFIAKTASLVYLSASLGGLTQPGFYRRLFDDLYKNSALTFFMGFVTIVLGALLVHVHGAWARDWTVLVTFLGWAALVKGIVIIACPRLLQRISEPLLSGSGQKVFPYITLAVGLLFGYFGLVH